MAPGMVRTAKLIPPGNAPDEDSGEEAMAHAALENQSLYLTLNGDISRVEYTIGNLKHEID